MHNIKYFFRIPTERLLRSVFNNSGSKEDNSAVEYLCENNLDSELVLNQ